MCIAATLKLTVLPGSARADDALPARQSVRMRTLPELRHVVRIHEAGLPVGDLLETWRARFGVDLTAEADAVANQKLIIHAEGQTAGVLLDEIAGLLTAQWLLDRPKGYRLVRDQRAHAYSARYFRERQARARLLRQARLKRYRAMIRLSLNAQQGKQGDALSNDSPPYLDPGGSTLLPLLASLKPAEVARLSDAGAEGGVFRAQRWSLARMSKQTAFAVPLSRLRESDRERVERLLRDEVGHWAQNETLVQNFNELIRDPDMVLHFGNYRGDSVNVCITSSRVPNWGPEFQILLGADTADDSRLNVDLSQEELSAFREYQKQIRVRQLCASPVISGRIEGLPDQDADRVLPHAYLSGVEYLESSKTVSYHAILHAVHCATAKTIVADYFTKPQRLRVRTAPPSLGDLLTDVGDVFGRDCTTSSVGLRLRSVAWPDDERAEVPLAVLRPWLMHKRQSKYLPGEDWLAMGGLTEAQLISLCEPSDLFGTLLTEEAAEALAGHGVLRLVSQLTSAQASRVRTPAGLRFSELSAVQQDYVLGFARTKLGPWVTREGLHQAFTFHVGTRKPEDQAPLGSIRMLAVASMMLPGGVGKSAVLPVRGDNVRNSRSSPS